MDARLRTIARRTGYDLKKVQKLVELLHGNERRAGQIMLFRRRIHDDGDLLDIAIFRDDLQPVPMVEGTTTHAP